MNPLPDNHPVAVNGRLYLVAQAGYDIAMEGVRRARSGMDHYHGTLVRLMPPGSEFVVKDHDGTCYRLVRGEAAGPVGPIPFVEMRRIPGEEDTKDFPAGMALDGAPAIPAEVVR